MWNIISVERHWKERQQRWGRWMWLDDWDANFDSFTTLTLASVLKQTRLSRQLRRTFIYTLSLEWIYQKTKKKVIGLRWLWYIVKWWLDTYISTSEQLQQHELRVSMWRGENCKKTFDTLAASAWFFFLHVMRCDIFSAMARTLSGSLISFFFW